MSIELQRLEDKIDILAKKIDGMREDLILMSARFGEHCRHEAQCEKHYALIYGNGQLGLKSRVELIEQEHIHADKKRTGLLLLVSGLASGIGSAIGFLFNRYTQ